MGERTMTGVLINESYWNQRITGQQRYATEIARRLERSDGLRPCGRPASGRHRTLRVWAWVQLVLPLVAQRRLVLSMTARAPFWRRRHVLVVHDLFVLTNPEWFSRRYVWTHAPLLRAQIRSAAVVVAVSQPVADQVARLRSGPVLVAPNAPSDVFRAVGRPAAAGRRRARPRAHAGNLLPRRRQPGPAQEPRPAGRGLRRAEHRRARPPSARARRRRIVDLPRRERRVRTAPSTRATSPTRSWRSSTVARVPSCSSAGRRDSGCRSWRRQRLARRACCSPTSRCSAGSAATNARYVDPSSVDAIRAGLRAEIDSPGGQKVDLGRFDWDASAAVIAEACVAATGGDASGHPLRSANA